MSGHLWFLAPNFVCNLWRICITSISDKSAYNRNIKIVGGKRIEKPINAGFSIRFWQFAACYKIMEVKSYDTNTKGSMGAAVRI